MFAFAKPFQFEGKAEAKNHQLILWFSLSGVDRLTDT
jgi:hypothetical protein